MSQQQHNWSEGRPPVAPWPPQSRTLQHDSSQGQHPSSRPDYLGHIPGLSDSSRRELPPLQPVPTQSVEPLVGVSSILNPPASSTTSYSSVQLPHHGLQGSGTQAAFPQGERSMAASTIYDPRSSTHQHSAYGPPPSQRPGLPTSQSYGAQSGSQWYSTSLPPFPAPNISIGNVPQTVQGHTPTAASPYDSQVQRPDYTMGLVNPTPQWQTESRRRPSSSVASSERPSLPSDPSRNPDQPVMMTLQTDDGPVPVPLNIQTASRAADEKRRRNAGASARFRQRRKEKEQASTSAIDLLKERIEHLEEDSTHLRSERDYFARVVYNSSERDRHFPRPPSPRRFRRPAQGASASQTSSPNSSSSYQEAGSREPEGPYGRRQLTEELQSLPPQVGQQDQQSAQYGYNTATGQSGRGQQPIYASASYQELPPPQLHQQQQLQQSHTQSYQAQSYSQQYASSETDYPSGSARASGTSIPERGYSQHQWSQDSQPQQRQ